MIKSENDELFNDGASTSGLAQTTYAKSKVTITQETTGHREESDHEKENPLNKIHQDREHDIKRLHEAIKNGEIKEVEKFWIKYPSETIACYHEKSALSTALIYYQKSIYDFMLSKKFSLHSRENILEVLEQESNVQKFQRKEIFSLHLKYSTQFEHDYLSNLWEKCRLSHNCETEQEIKYFEEIFRALLKLNTISEIKILLEVVALSSDLRIYFDFENDHIGCIDPRLNVETEGFFNHSFFCILIGAKNLLDPKKCFEVHGTIAHEFCHCALYKILKNNAKPFSSDDNVKKDQFANILSICSENKNFEPIISITFEYPISQQEGELIARVPHILAKYQKKEKELTNIRSKFKELFDFYDRLIPSLESELGKLKLTYSVEHANKATGVLTKLETYPFTPSASVIDDFELNIETNHIQIYRSNCIDFTMKILYEKLKANQFQSFVIFSDNQIFENEMIRKTCVDALKRDKNTRLIIAFKNSNASKIVDLSEKLQPLKEFIILTEENIDSTKKFNELKVFHTFSDLSVDSQNIVLSKFFNFQGIEIEFRAIWERNKDIINAFPLESMLSSDSMKLGQKIEFNENYVTRNFINESLSYKNRLTHHDMKSIAENKKVVLLSDAPGNGKSTEFKKLSEFLKKNFPSHWIVWIDLKKHFENFRKYQIKNDNFKSCSQVAEFFAFDLIKIENFEAEIFIKFFTNNLAIILLDGFDEISPTFKDLTSNLAVTIKNETKNQLWIATRPHLEQELQTELKLEDVFCMEAFDEEKQETFFKNFFISLDSSEKTFEEFYKDVKQLLLKIKGGWRKTAANPLFLKMIATVLIENSEPNSWKNLYQIYEKFVEKMFKRAFDKGEDAKDDLLKMEKIKKIHLKKAVEVLLRQDQYFFESDSSELSSNCSSDDSLWRQDLYLNESYYSERIYESREHEFLSFCHHEKMITEIFDDIDEISSDTLCRIGLMFNNEGTFFFIHRTFAEFFVAQLLCENLLHKRTLPNDKIEVLVKLFVNIINGEDFDFVRMFLDDYLKVHNNETDQFLLSKSRKKVQTNDFSFKFCTHYIHLIKYISFEIIKNHEYIKKILQTPYDSQMTILEMSPERIFKDALEFYAEIFNADEMSSIVFKKKKKKSLFERSIEQKSRIKVESTWKYIRLKLEFEYSVKVLKELPVTHSVRIFLRDFACDIILWCRNNDFLQHLDFLCKMMSFLTIEEVHIMCLWMYSCGILALDYDCSHLFLSNEQDQTCTLDLAHFLLKLFKGMMSEGERIQIFKTNEQLKHTFLVFLINAFSNHYEASVFSGDNDNKSDTTSDHDSYENIENSYILKHLETFSIKVHDLLFFSNFKSESILMQLNAKQNFRTLKTVMELMKFYLKPLQMQEILFKHNNDGNNILTDADFIKNCGENLRKLSEDGKISTNFLKSDENGLNIIWYTAVKKSSDHFGTWLRFVVQLFKNSSEFEIFTRTLLAKNKCGHNLFHMLINKHASKTFEVLWRIVEVSFRTETKIKILMAVDEVGRTLISKTGISYPLVRQHFEKTVLEVFSSLNQYLLDYTFVSQIFFYFPMFCLKNLFYNIPSEPLFNTLNVIKNTGVGIMSSEVFSFFLDFFLNKNYALSKSFINQSEELKFQILIVFIAKNCQSRRWHTEDYDLRSYIVEWMFEFQCKCGCGSVPIHFLLHCDSSYFMEIIKMLSFKDCYSAKSLLRQFTNDNKSIFMLSSERFININVFKIFNKTDLQQILQERDSNNNTVIDYAVHNIFANGLRNILELYSLTFEENKLEEILMRQDKNILKLAIQNVQKLNTLRHDNGSIMHRVTDKIDLVWNFMVKNLNEKKIQQIFLESVEFIDSDMQHIFEPCLLKLCVKFEPLDIFHIWIEIASTFSFDFIQKLIQTIEQQKPHPKRFFRSLNKFDEQQDKSLIESALKNTDKRVADLLSSKMKDSKVIKLTLLSGLSQRVRQISHRFLKNAN